MLTPVIVKKDRLQPTLKSYSYFSSRAIAFLSDNGRYRLHMVSMLDDRYW